MLKQSVACAALAGSLVFAGTAAAQTTPAAQPAVEAPAQPNNYGDAKSWLCRPGRQDACAVDLSTTIVAADGRLTKETWTADANAPVDCFYVYPTVSTDATPNSDMSADPAELNVVRQQFARLASKCRPYARACTNPASLGGGSGQLHAYLTKDGGTITSTMPPKPWVVPEMPIETPWVSVPGLLTAECKTNENATYLEITVHGNPADSRVDDITGDLGLGTQVLANWGLHLIDVNLAMGNLVDLVGQQAKAYIAKSKAK